MSSYNYYITVLKKVSFDEELFQKEYEKRRDEMNSL